MKQIIDISDFVNVLTPDKAISNLVERFIQRRKEYGISQKKLSIKSGVSYSSIRRFESTGNISLSSLIKIANAIECLSDFNDLFIHPLIKDLKDYK